MAILQHCAAFVKLCLPSIYVWVIIASVCLAWTLASVHAEEECLNSNIDCYYCSSADDYRCGDPFNNTNGEMELTYLKRCQGCCVKIVTINNSEITVRRTCTERLQINLFLVDHVCMYESDGNGHMCFCESDMCNSGPNQPTPVLPLILPIGLLCVMHRFYTTRCT